MALILVRASFSLDRYWSSTKAICQRFAATEWLLALSAGTIIGVAFSYPMLLHLTSLGMFADWDFFMQMQLAARQAILRFHQLPLWNPYKCGGLPLLGNPQSHFISPWFILTLLFGPATGLHLEVVGHCIIAWTGTYVLGRTLRMKPLAAAGAACTFATSSWYNLHATEGHMIFLPIAYAPWVLAFTYIGLEPGRFIALIGAGAMVALTILEGSGYAPMLVCVTLVAVMLALSIGRLSIRPLWALAVVAIFAAGFSAIKALPALRLLSSVPRLTSSSYSNTWELIRVALFSHNQDRMRSSPNLWGFHESGAYLGLFAFPALVGLCKPRRAWPWLAAGIVLILLARGSIGSHSLWEYLHRLPIGSSMRLPSRFLIMLTLAVGVLAGIGFDAMLEWRWRGARWLVLGLIAAGLLDNFWVGGANLNYVFRSQQHPGAAQPIFRQYLLDGAKMNSYSLTLENKGIIKCYEYTDWRTKTVGADQKFYRGEQHMAGPGTVRLVSWSPNRLEFEVYSPTRSAVVVNQNYDPGWHLAQGQGSVLSLRGILAVAVPPGRQSIVLSYRGIAFDEGAIISLLSLLVAGALVWYQRRRL